MGKLLSRLEKQLKTEYKQDAEDCLKIYNKLKEIHDGHIWESDWNPLVSTRFIGSYPNYESRFKPTVIGNLFLKGLKNENKL
jgi:hypothetical protein